MFKTLVSIVSLSAQIVAREVAIRATKIYNATDEKLVAANAKLIEKSSSK